MRDGGRPLRRTRLLYSHGTTAMMRLGRAGRFNDQINVCGQTKSLSVSKMRVKNRRASRRSQPRSRHAVGHTKNSPPPPLQRDRLFLIVPGEAIHG